MERRHEQERFETAASYAVRRHRNGGCRGVIFDLDGTLVDTLEGITRALNAVLGAHPGGPLTPPAVRPMVGLGLSNLLQSAANVSDPETLATLLAQYRAEYARVMLDCAGLFPGLRAVLDMLTESAVPMCVLSNKPTEFTRPMCEALLHEWPFVRTTGPMPPDARKPDPTQALELSRAMGCDAADVFFVGDSPVDVETARNAGMVSVAVTWGYRDRDLLDQASPDHIVDDPATLRRLLSAAIAH